MKAVVNVTLTLRNVLIMKHELITRVVFKYPRVTRCVDYQIILRAAICLKVIMHSLNPKNEDD